MENLIDIDMDEDDFSTLEICYLGEDFHSQKSKFLRFDNPSVCLYVLAKMRYLMYLIFFFQK